MIVVDWQLAIIEVTDESSPTSQAVIDRFPCGRAIRDLAALAGEPLSQGLCWRSFWHRYRRVLAREAPVGVPPEIRNVDWRPPPATVLCVDSDRTASPWIDRIEIFGVPIVWLQIGSGSRHANRRLARRYAQKVLMESHDHRNEHTLLVKRSCSRNAN
jgi:hypothetical protein